MMLLLALCLHIGEMMTDFSSLGGSDKPPPKHLNIIDESELNIGAKESRGIIIFISLLKSQMRNGVQLSAALCLCFVSALP